MNVTRTPHALVLYVRTYVPPGRMHSWWSRDDAASNQSGLPDHNAHILAEQSRVHLTSLLYTHNFQETRYVKKRSYSSRRAAGRKAESWLMLRTMNNLSNNPSRPFPTYFFSFFFALMCWCAVWWVSGCGSLFWEGMAALQVHFEEGDA